MLPEDDRALVASILEGDRAALNRLVAREHSWLVRLARAIVKDEARAAEVAQDSWIAIMRALRTFEGRSALRTWMATIVLNRAKTIAARGARTVPVADFANDSIDDEDDADAGSFTAGFWSLSKAPGRWHEATPEALLERRQIAENILSCVDRLPENQRTVLTLRDVEGWSSEEVRNALGLSESNQRVVLHRARAKLRAALEAALGDPRS